MIRYMIGSNAVTKAATEVTYKTVWVAGPTIEYTHGKSSHIWNNKKTNN
jgi:nitronate monooxygenase